MALEVVSEGIVTWEQLAFLKEKECQIGQRYLFSRPLAAAEMRGILMEGQLVVG